MSVCRRYVLKSDCIAYSRFGVWSVEAEYNMSKCWNVISDFYFYMNLLFSKLTFIVEWTCLFNLAGDVMQQNNISLYLAVLMVLMH